MEQNPIRDRKLDFETLQELQFKMESAPTKIISLKRKLDIIDPDYLEKDARPKVDVTKGLTKAEIAERRRLGYVNVINGLTKQSWMSAFMCCAARPSSQEDYTNVILKYLSAESKVLRDGKVVKIPREELVPGDILILSKGDKVNADALLLEISKDEKELALNTFLYTETDVPYQKEKISSMGDPWERQELLLAGTEVVAGGGKAMVLAVGDQTAIGIIMKSFEEKGFKKR